MSDPLKLELPLPPNLANGRMHWRAKHRKRGLYHLACDLAMMARTIPQPPASPLSPVTISSTLYVWSFNDDDNATARLKWAADWCKTRGYIVDDRRPHARFTIPEQVIDRSNQRLVLTLTPTEP